MRRKKDNRMVLRSGNGRQYNSQRKRRRFNPPRQFAPSGGPINRRNRQKRKANKSLVLVMIIALIAFVIGAGIGVSLCIDDDTQSDDTPHYKNVTKKMIKKVDDKSKKKVSYNKKLDNIDFNENDTSRLDVKYK